jgi:hypothetical protein
MKRRMRWTLAAVGALVSAALLGGREAAAMAGQCLQRNTPSDVWSPNNLPFEQCRDLNQARDGDNVFDPQGLVWWRTS